MLYDLTITRADVGSVIGPPNAWLIDLRQIESGSNEPAMADPSGKWLSAYLQLRGSLDHRDLLRDSVAEFRLMVRQDEDLIANHSLPYSGDLIVRCVPKDAVFEISLSDVELTQRERDERAKEIARKQLAKHIAALQRKADDLAPPEPAPPLQIERREPVLVEADRPKTPARRR